MHIISMCFDRSTLFMPGSRLGSWKKAMPGDEGLQEASDEVWQALCLDKLKSK